MDYTLHLGDCLEYMRTLSDGCVDAVVTDPPYGIGANGQTLGLAGHKYKRTDTEWDERVDIQPFMQFPYVCIWGGNYYADVLPPTNQWLVWDKKNYASSFSEVEMAWTNFSPQSRIFYKHWGREKEFHPTQKPLSLMHWCLSFLPEGCTVFDPYMGSGTTGVACIQTGRKFIGCEIDEGYFEIAQRRIEEAAQQPLLLETT